MPDAERSQNDSSMHQLDVLNKYLNGKQKEVNGLRAFGPTLTKVLDINSTKVLILRLGSRDTEP